MLSNSGGGDVGTLPEGKQVNGATLARRGSTISSQGQRTTTNLPALEPAGVQRRRSVSFTGALGFQLQTEADQDKDLSVFKHDTPGVRKLREQAKKDESGRVSLYEVGELLSNWVNAKADGSEDGNNNDNDGRTEDAAGPGVAPAAPARAPSASS